MAFDGYRRTFFNVRLTPANLNSSMWVTKLVWSPICEPARKTRSSANVKNFNSLLMKKTKSIIQFTTWKIYYFIKQVNRLSAWMSLVTLIRFNFFLCQFLNQ